MAHTNIERKRRIIDGKRDSSTNKNLGKDSSKKSDREIKIEQDRDDLIKHEAIVKLFEKKRGFNNRTGSIR